MNGCQTERFILAEKFQHSSFDKIQAAILYMNRNQLPPSTKPTDCPFASTQIPKLQYYTKHLYFICSSNSTNAYTERTNERTWFIEVLDNCQIEDMNARRSTKLRSLTVVCHDFRCWLQWWWCCCCCRLLNIQQCIIYNELF